jgi:hypothetical protein
MVVLGGETVCYRRARTFILLGKLISATTQKTNGYTSEPELIFLFGNYDHGPARGVGPGGRPTVSEV